MRASARIAACVLLVAGLTLSAGCTTAAKRAYYEIRGAKGEIRLIDDLTREEFAGYQSLRFEPATTTIGPKLCPRTLRQAYDHYAHRLVDDLREDFPGGEPALAISTDVLYFQKKGLLGAAQLLCRVRFRENDRVVGDALVNVASKGFREGAADDLAETAVETIGKFLGKRSPPDEEDSGRRKDR